MLVLVFFVFALCAAYAQWLWERRHMIRLAAEVPTFPGGLPVIGNTHQIIGDSCHLFQVLKAVSDHANENGGISKVWIQMKPHFVITDPKDAIIALNSCLNKNYMYGFLKPWLGEGMFTSNGKTSLTHRRMLVPAFTPQILNNFFGIFNRQSRKLVKSLDENVGAGPFDPLDVISYNNLETIFETSFGVPEGGMVIDNNYAIACHKMLEIAMKRFLNVFVHLNFIYKWTKLKKEQDEVVKILHTYSNNVIQKKKAAFITNNEIENNKENKFRSLLQMMLELNVAKGVLNDRQMREEVDSIIFAGHDTSSVVLLYCLILLGSHPKVQDKAYEEIKDVFGDTDRDVDKDDIGRMVFIEAVIQETLRLYPIGAAVAREVNKDLKLSRHTIPAGSSCLVLFWGMHRGPCWGPDANDFKPERWLDPATMPDPSSFGGFSLGKRRCFGKTYALMSMKTILAHILRKYRVTADHTKLKLKLDIMLRPVSGHFITLQYR